MDAFNEALDPFEGEMTDERDAALVVVVVVGRAAASLGLLTTAGLAEEGAMDARRLAVVDAVSGARVVVVAGGGLDAVGGGALVDFLRPPEGAVTLGADTVGFAGAALDAPAPNVPEFRIYEHGERN